MWICEFGFDACRLIWCCIYCQLLLLFFVFGILSSFSYSEIGLLLWCNDSSLFRYSFVLYKIEMLVFISSFGLCYDVFFLFCLLCWNFVVFLG